MASSSSSKPSPDNGTIVTITRHEFNQFHKIDRILFTRLVVSLGRDPGEAMKVVAYLVWLEKWSKDFRLVSKLLHWPDPSLNDLANEAILALNCVESDHFPYDANIIGVLPLTQSVTQKCVTIHYLHENRVSVICAIRKIINEVCLRAFPDIVQEIEHEKEQNLMNNSVGNIFGQFICYNSPQAIGIVPQRIGIAVSQDEIFDDANELFRSIDEERMNNIVPPDDRTIFMTFSKGYPILEAEVRDYFSRRFGDVIEGIYMQEVPLMEQPLYARLVVRSNAINVIDVFLEGTGTVKFCINGKHVWARKYVRKSPSPSHSPSPSPSPGKLAFM
ncbi:uncharacterized protein G2W53_032610 [Senna tora]|uniref:Uncharacterized protein n=1 Tax=Senna tora TaxID=362788 RepID=A0A834T837_9FABA|nr:uncharacterized protein G2W53_032610 [Senna tora]